MPAVVNEKLPEVLFLLASVDETLLWQKRNGALQVTFVGCNEEKALGLLSDRRDVSPISLPSVSPNEKISFLLCVLCAAGKPVALLAKENEQSFFGPSSKDKVL